MLATNLVLTHPADRLPTIDQLSSSPVSTTSGALQTATALRPTAIPATESVWDSALLGITDKIEKLDLAGGMPTRDTP